VGALPHDSDHLQSHPAAI
jgi:hypothetical protein